jgi:hypothetical protein
MNSNKKTTQPNSPTRRKFVLGAGILSMMAIVGGVMKLPFSIRKNIIPGKPENKKTTTKMLTQDGRLVEIDNSVLTSGRKKITDTELQNWIKR